MGPEWMSFGVSEMQTTERTKIETYFSKNGITTSRYQIRFAHPQLMEYEKLSGVKEKCWLQPVANNNEVLASVHTGATDLRARLDDPWGFLSIQNILQFLPQ